MTRERGSLLWVGVPGPEPSTARPLLESIRPGGVVLFGRNIRDASQLHDLIARLKGWSPEGLWVALDQEGGRVDRLRNLLGPSPPARRLARAGAGAARKFGELTGRALSLLGVDVDFAPVLDLDHGQESGAIGDRAWAADPEGVSGLAGAFLGGLQEKGPLGCLKHWPGLGRAEADPHRDLPVVAAGKDVLRLDREPFLSLLSEVSLVMTAHCLYPEEDPGCTPATCCEDLLSPLRKAGFGGCLVADDLEMGALGGDVSGAAVASLEAGCNILLVCGAGGEAAEDCRRALMSRVKSESRIREAMGYVERLGPPSRPQPFDLAAWEALAEEYRRFCDPLLEEGPGADPTER